jgi:hypothetical protein
MRAEGPGKFNLGHRLGYIMMMISFRRPEGANQLRDGNRGAVKSL